MTNYPFQHVVTKLRTTRGSEYALEVMADAAERIDSAVTAWWGATEMLDDGTVGYVSEERMEAALDAIWEALGHADMKRPTTLSWLSPAGTRHDDNTTDEGRALRLEQGWKVEERTDVAP